MAPSRTLKIAVIVAIVGTACRTTSPKTGSSVKDLPSAGYSGPYLAATVNEPEVWSKYCKGSYTDVAEPILPNYDDEEVKVAAKNLSTISVHSFAIYGQINRHYKNLTPPPNLQVGTETAQVTTIAQDFLVYLCGEFRDRTTMIVEKINWLKNFNYLSPVDQPAIDLERAKRESIWLQVTAKAYRPYLQFSQQFYSAKRQTLASQKHTFGAISGIDRPTAPVSICETKFIFAEYVAKTPPMPFPGLSAFQAAYETWSEDSTGNCVPEDKEFVYDFRGDGNFKPNSPEGNGMIWSGISSSLQCLSRTKSRKEAVPPISQPATQKLILSDADCTARFTRPFAFRWNGARAGLGAWVLRDKSQDDVASSTGNLVTVMPDWAVDFSRAPFNFTVLGEPGRFPAGLDAAYASRDFGLPVVAETTDPELRKQFIYQRLRDSVDRHTDWYASGYDDGMNQGRTKTDSYSPFVASSYEMSASDSFTAPCYTIPCIGEVPARNWKHFMFVFKVNKKLWFNSDSIQAGEVPDFDRNWFDETSLGTVSLAKTERAFDRLGTALEGEYDSILYLHNICANGLIEKIETSGMGCDGSQPATSP